MIEYNSGFLLNCSIPGLQSVSLPDRPRGESGSDASFTSFPRRALSAELRDRLAAISDRLPVLLAFCRFQLVAKSIQHGLIALLAYLWKHFILLFRYVMFDIFNQLFQ